MRFFSTPGVMLAGQTAAPGSQQTSSPDFNAWVDFYRQPMAYFNQGTAQTQAPGLQVRRGVGGALSPCSRSPLTAAANVLTLFFFVSPAGPLEDCPGERLELERRKITLFITEGVLDLQRLARLFVLVKNTSCRMTYDKVIFLKSGRFICY